MREPDPKGSGNLTKSNLIQLDAKMRSEEARRQGRSTPETEPDPHDYDSDDSGGGNKLPPRTAEHRAEADRRYKEWQAKASKPGFWGDASAWTAPLPEDLLKRIRENEAARKRQAEEKQAARAGLDSAIEKHLAADRARAAEIDVSKRGAQAAANQMVDGETAQPGGGAQLPSWPPSWSQSFAEIPREPEALPQAAHPLGREPGIPPLGTMPPPPIPPIVGGFAAPPPTVRRTGGVLGSHTATATLPHDFPRYLAAHRMTEVAAYLANASYVISVGGPPLADLKYGIIVVPVGEESLLFGRAPDHVLDRDFLDAVAAAKHEYECGEPTASGTEDDDGPRPTAPGPPRFDDDFASRRTESFGNVETSPPGKTGGPGVEQEASRDDEPQTRLEERRVTEAGPPPPRPAVASSARKTRASAGTKRKVASDAEGAVLEPEGLPKRVQSRRRSAAIRAAERTPSKAKTATARKRK